MEEKIFNQIIEAYTKYAATHDELDTYFRCKTKAKQFESDYIEAMDMSLSGMDVSKAYIESTRYAAQVYWNILAVKFNKPQRTVSFMKFDLEEFNEL